MENKKMTSAFARSMLIVLILAITVFSLASCGGLQSDDIQGMLGGQNPIVASCDHIYDNACDFQCNICGAMLMGYAWHYFDDDCDTECNSCGAIRVTRHFFDDFCDADCNVCDFTRVPEHAWLKGVCKLCGIPRETEHTYDNACDTDCNTCGAAREIEHSYVDGVCSECGATDESVLDEVN